MTEMTPAHQRRDALSGITLVESSATLLTQGLFGMIFAAFSEVGHPSLTFFCNTVRSIQRIVLLDVYHLDPPILAYTRPSPLSIFSFLCM